MFLTVLKSLSVKRENRFPLSIIGVLYNTYTTLLFSDVKTRNLNNVKPSKFIALFSKVRFVFFFSYSSPQLCPALEQ